MYRLATHRLQAYFEARHAAKRRREIADDFPDFLRYMSTCLRAGLSLRQALAESAERIKGPMGDELAISSRETKAGVPVAEALAGLATRTGFPDAAAATAILRASLRYGGDSAAALDRLCETAVRRSRMREEANALTAQARFSAIILSVLPLGFFALFPAPAGVLLSPKGIMVILIGLVLDISGYLILRRLADPERLN